MFMAIFQAEEAAVSKGNATAVVVNAAVGVTTSEVSAYLFPTIVVASFLCLKSSPSILIFPVGPF